MSEKCDVCHKRGVRTHRFPHDDELACLWAEALGWEEDFDKMVLIKRHRSITICTSHFHESSYYNNDKIKGKLKPNQLPVTYIYK